MSCIDLMNDPTWTGKFDAIVTDIPFAIDMDNLNQQNQHGGMKDINKVEDAHQVEENMDLMRKFFPSAFKCTTDKAFLCTFCDVMLWQYMYDLAIEAGWAVQRWPIVWRKVNQTCMNNSPQYNTTKDYEIVMVCRKQGAVFAKNRNSSIMDASNTEVRKLFGHPFSKPFEITKMLVEMTTIPRSLILEPFAGGGSMVVEILKQERRVIACEKEEHWYNSLLTNVKTQFFLKNNPKAVFK
jgi:DNA modification methylase